MTSTSRFHINIGVILTLAALFGTIAVTYLELSENQFIPNYLKDGWSLIMSNRKSSLSTRKIPAKFQLPKSEWQEIREQHLRMVMQSIEMNYLHNDTVFTSKFVVAHCGFPPGLSCYDKYFIALVDNWFPQEGKGCHYPEAKCKGFGDRVRGMVIAFYLAIGMHRRFMVNWPWPSDITQYFDTNDHLFLTPRNELDNSSISYLRNWIFNQDYGAEEEFSTPLRDPDFFAKYDFKDYIGVMSNRFAGLDNVFSNKAFRPQLAPIISQLPDADYVTHNITQFQNEILITAALRTVLRKPNSRLSQIVNFVIDKTVGREKWLTTLKIGVQIRGAKIQNDDQNSRVDITTQGHCFGKEIENILYHRFPRNVSFIVFLTADFTDNSIELLRSGSQSYLSNASIITSEMAFPNLTVSHIERPIFDGDDSQDEVWFKTAKTYVDWLLLTQTDMLVITRSGFGESAAQFSMVPTRRFEHWSSKNHECRFHDYYSENSFTSVKRADIPLNYPLNLYEILR